MGIDEISVSIGRLQATLESHVQHSNRRHETIEHELKAIRTIVGTVPDLKKDTESIEIRVRDIENAANQSTGAKAVFLAIAGAIGAGLIKTIDVIVK